MKRKHAGNQQNRRKRRFVIYIKLRIQNKVDKISRHKCFLLNPEKNLKQIRLVVYEKNAKTHL